MEKVEVLQKNDVVDEVFVVVVASKKNVRYIIMEEVEKYNIEDDCWIVVKGKVYDVNVYLKEGLYLGGNVSIIMNAGEDITEDFEVVYSVKVWKQFEFFYIGDVGSVEDQVVLSDVLVEIE